MRTLIVTSLLVLLLTGCRSPEQAKPSIQFIGIGAGSLKTPVEEIRFRDMFDVGESELVGVVAFDHIEEGTTVQATWFSPDERRMPLGRTNIVTQSGATVARFSFASREPWQPAPYMLRIDAMKGEGDEMLTASGSTSFFIGMKQRDVDRYRKEFDEWSKADAAHRAEVEAKIEAERVIVERANEVLGSDDGSLILRRDLTGDGAEEFLIASTGEKEEAPMPSSGGGPGVLASGGFDQFLLTDLSGTSLLAMRSGRRFSSVYADGVSIVPEIQATDPVTVTVLPSGTFSLSWNTKKEACTVDVRRVGVTWEAGEVMCEEREGRSRY
ncbi:MAG: hypothetical protein PHZ00_03220 [Candidatus Peribacteraceae bacterium]|nr:hypothetical protein [Candidatus Peribacteraceae bacterium]